MINTGMTGGVYGVGSRMKLPYTRTMITEALNGNLDKGTFFKHPIFGIEIPQACAGVPSEILDPRAAWSDKAAYDQKANELAGAFNKNFEKFAAETAQSIKDAAPKVITLSNNNEKVDDAKQPTENNGGFLSKLMNIFKG
jgi:phosphoenolpyruvate carboxykinase (ATP)